jgi:xanthine dehydrogenase molybdenum-binding subunit
VRLEFTRKETFLGGRSRHPGTVWLKQGFRKDGTITARQARVTLNSGAYGSHGPGVTAVGTTALTSLYRCENVHLEGRCVYTNTPIAGAYRGYGVVQTYYALDIQMDEAAEKLGIDPAELKLRNAVREGDLAPSGHAIVGHGLEDCIRRGMEETNWKRIRGQGANSFSRTQKPNSHPDPEFIRRGWGMGCEMHGSSAYPGIKEQGNATVRMNEDGTVQLFTGTTGLGTGAHTALAQIVAEELGVRFEDVSVVHGDTDVVPWDIGAFASHTTYMGGRAAQMAAAEVKTKLLESAAEALEAATADLEVKNGVISVKGSDRHLSVRDAVSPKRGIPSAHLIASATYKPTKSYSFAAHFVEVQVDVQTGQIDVLQVIPVHEIGKVIHRWRRRGRSRAGSSRASATRSPRTTRSTR